MAKPLEGIDASLKGAAKVIDAEYRLPYLAHAPMEPLNCTMQAEVADNKATAVKVWVGSQFQTIDQAAIARTLGLAPEKVTLNTMMLAAASAGARCRPRTIWSRPPTCCALDRQRPHRAAQGDVEP